MNDLVEFFRGWGLELPPHPDVPGENRLSDS